MKDRDAQRLKCSDNISKLTIEAYFCGIALQGLLANSSIKYTEEMTADDFDNWQNSICESACIIGTEMVNKYNARQ